VLRELPFYRANLGLDPRFGSMKDQNLRGSKFGRSNGVSTQRVGCVGGLGASSL
jgi:hypothetical protein